MKSVGGSKPNQTGIATHSIERCQIKIEENVWKISFDGKEINSLVMAPEESFFFRRKCICWHMRKTLIVRVCWRRVKDPKTSPFWASASHLEISVEQTSSIEFTVLKWESFYRWDAWGTKCHLRKGLRVFKTVDSLVYKASDCLDDDVKETHRDSRMWLQRKWKRYQNVSIPTQKFICLNYLTLSLSSDFKQVEHV